MAHDAGEIDRAAVAAIVFSRPEERERGHDPLVVGEVHDVALNRDGRGLDDLLLRLLALDLLDFLVGIAGALLRLDPRHVDASREFGVERRCRVCVVCFGHRHRIREVGERCPAAPGDRPRTATVVRR